MTTPRRTVVHPRATARPPKKGPFSYLLPFLVIIGIGILAVLIYNFFSQGPSVSGSGAQATLTLEEGSAKVKPWGEETYTDAHNGDILYAGDQLEVDTTGLATLTLSDESTIHLDADTTLKIDSLEPQTKKLAFTLEAGKAWFNLTTEQDLLLTTPSALTEARKGIFGAEINKDSTTLYSILGSLETSLVQEKSDGRTTILQKFMLQANEQLLISPDKLAYLISGGTTTASTDTTKPTEGTETETPTTPKFIEPLSSEITTSTWYQDNLTRDGRDDLLTTGDDDDTTTSEEPEDTTKDDETTTKDETKDEETTKPADTVTLTTPKITSPKDGTTLTKDSFVLSGTTSSATAKIIVTNSAMGTPYTLSRYTAGSTTWSYNAAVAFGNMKEGKNTYTVVAVDAEGNQSPAAKITLTYQTSKPTTEETTTTTTDKPTTPTKDETPTTPTKVTPATPTITIPTSSASYEAAVSELAIGGSVDANTTKIYVNGIAIAFTAGSTRWSTIVPLMSGQNIFSVMAESADGSRSAPSMITINLK